MTRGPVYKVYKRRGLRGLHWHWNLVAANGEVVATSESYTSESGALNGIEVVRRTAPAAPVTWPES